VNSSILGENQILKNKILVVEGDEEKRFLLPYLDYHSVSDIQILPIGGKTRLSDSLKALVLDPNFVSNVEVVGIMRDADKSAKSTFQSVCSALSNADLPIPSEPLKFTGEKPKVSILIIPPGEETGSLEGMCLKSVDDNQAISCVNSYFSCLNSLPGYVPTVKLSKARIHTYLASKEDPDKRLGEAAEKGYWPFNNPAFESLKTFINTF